ncbi:MAG: hypothetical protein WCT29_00555 [Candidatus Paceibacterota bacterium]|jgi:hypothetical protein
MISKLVLRGDETDEFVISSARLSVHSPELNNPAPKLFSRKVLVDRDAIQQQIEDLSGRKHIDPEVLRFCRYGTGIEEVELFFFFLPRFTSSYELFLQYRRYGLRADFQAQLALCLQDPNFAKQYPSGLQMLVGGRYAYALLFWWNQKQESFLVRDYSQFTGGRAGLRDMSAFYMGGVKLA